MGVDIARPDWTTIKAAPEEVSEWEVTIAKLAECSRDEIAAVRESLLPAPETAERRDPHAYMDSELEQIRRLVRPNPEKDIEQLRFHTDLFAIFIGMRVQSTSRLTPKVRAEKLWNGVVLPSKSLVSAICEYEIGMEIVRGHLLPQEVSLKTFADALVELEKRTKARCDELRKENRRGKQWDAELCADHVYLAALLCEYLNERFEPQRGKRFAGVVRLLARPIFPPSSSFTKAIRHLSEGLKTIRSDLQRDPVSWLRRFESGVS